MLGAMGNNDRTGYKKTVGPPASVPVVARGNSMNVTDTNSGPRQKQCFRCHSYNRLVSQCPARASAPGQNSMQARAQYSGTADWATLRVTPPANVTRVVAERTTNAGRNNSKLPMPPVSDEPGDKAVRTVDLSTAEVRRCAVNHDDDQSNDVSVQNVTTVNHSLIAKINSSPLTLRSP